MTTKPDTLRASDKQRAALAQRLVKHSPRALAPTVTVTAEDVFRPKAKPESAPPAPKPALNEFEIAGRARRKAYRERERRIKLVLEKLVAQFPNCFKPPGESKRPLKIGIREDIAVAMPDISHNDLKLALGKYVRDKTYRQPIIEGAVRVDLNGDPTTAVTQKESRWPPQARVDS